MAGRDLEFGIRITADGKVLIAEAGRAEKAIGSIGKTVESVNRNTGALTDSFARMGHTAAAAFSVREIAKATDAWANMESRIALSANSLQDAQAAMDGVFRIAQKSGGDLAGIADVYQKIARNAVQYGMDQQAALGVTEALANAVRLSGASAASASAALMQFGQALSSGVLRGEELNSVMEQTPALAEAIARGMGKTVGELRKMGEEGQLEAGKVLEAIRKESARLESEVASMTPTIENSMQRLKNAFVKEMGEGAGGAAKLAAQGVDALAQNLDAATKAAVLLGGAFAAMRVPAIVAAMTSLNPAVLAIGAGLVGLSVAWKDWEIGAIASTSNVAKDIDALASGIARTNAQIATMGRTAAETALADAKRARAVDVAELDKLRSRYERDYGGDKRQTSRFQIAERDALRAQIVQAESALARLDGEMASMQSRLGQAGVKAVTDFYAEFGSKTTKAAEEIKKLNEGWNKAASALAAQGDTAGLIKLENEYNAKRAEIVKAATDEANRLQKERFANRLELMKQASDEELQVLDTLHASGLVAEIAYQDKRLAITLGGIDKQIAATQAQIKATKDPADKAKLEGDLQKLIALAFKADSAYMETLGKMDKARAAFWRDGIEGNARAAAEQADALLVSAKAAEEENAKIGLTAEGLAALTKKRYDEKIGLLQTEAVRLEAIAGRDGEAYAVRQQIAALERLRDAEIARPKLQEQAEAWKSFTADIERALTDSLYRSFESGKGFGETFAESLKNTFKSMVLKVAVQTIVSPVTSALGLGGSSSGGGLNLFGAINTASNTNSLFNSPFLTGNFSNTAYGQFATSGLGQSLGLGTAPDFAASLHAQANAEMLGASFMEEESAAALADATGLLEGGLTSFGQMLPYLGAALVAISLLNKDGGGPKTEGMSFITLGQSGYQNDSRSGEHGYTGDGADAQINQILDPLGRGLRDMAIKLGGDATGLQIGMGYNTDPAGSAPDNISGRVIVGDQTVYQHTYDAARGSYSQELSAETPRVMLAALKALDLNDLADSFLDSLQIESLSADAATQALAFVGATSQVVAAFAHLGVSADNVTTDLVDAMGGIDATSASLSAYYQGYYTDQERLAAMTADLGDQFRALGVEMPSSRDEFRALIESIDLTGEAGRATYASLINLAPAFGTVADAAEQATADILRAAEGTSGMFADSIRGVKLDSLDTAGKYAWLDAEGSRYKTTLESLTDPDLIDSYSRRLNGTIMQAWGLLTEEQRASRSDEYVALLTQADNLAASRYTAAQDAARDEARQLANVQADAIAARVEAAVARAMSAAVGAADAQTESNAAVVEAISNLRVQVDVSGLWRTAEVGSWD